MSDFSHWLTGKYSQKLLPSEAKYYSFWGWLALLGLLVVLVLSVGCTTCQPAKVIETTRVVTVPIPAPPVYSLPDLPIFGLDKDCSDAEFVQAIQESVLILMRDNQSLATLLESYREYAK